MSTSTNREPAPGEARSVDHRLARLLDTPLLARIVPHLAPEALHQLVRRHGLDACGTLVTSATPAQLTSLLDLDLWRRTQPGRDEQLDVERFGEWLEVLIDAGDSVAARTVAALDTSLIVAGLSRYLRVFDPGTFEPTESSDDEPLERHDRMNSETSRDVVEIEIGGYLVRARRADAWDAIVMLLAALETGHHDAFHAVMRGCRRLSNSRPEIDGLDDLLLAPEQHLQDVATAREQRQSRQGYATAADARAFLAMARQPRPAAMEQTNPIATAYFRAAEADDTASQDAPSAAVRRDDGGDDEDAASIEAVIELLAEAGVTPQRPRALLPAADADDPGTDRAPHLRRLMARLRLGDETAYLTRTRELAFLANTLLAGASVQSRPFTAQEASDAAACICNLGLECSAADGGAVDHSLVTAFEVGWSVLYRDVSLFAADQLISTLAGLRCFDADVRLGVDALRRALMTQCRAGTPWLARGAADVLAMLDMPAWIAVLGVLDECPILPAALTAVLERQTASVSPTAFEFISTTAQIAEVRRFLRALPGVLSG
jgi:hypothetical protein